MHFFLCLKEKSSKKEANERAARLPARSGFCHESPVSSARTRAVRTVLLPKAAVRFRTLRGSLGAYIAPWTCASRGVPLSDKRFPQSMISFPPGKGIEIGFLTGIMQINSCLAVLLKASHSRGRWRANGVTVGAWYTYMTKTAL